MTGGFFKTRYMSMHLNPNKFRLSGSLILAPG